MEVGSPENGFDEISDLFKHDESTLPEDLDLSFLVNKDTCADEINFHFSEQGQSELPSLLSNFRYYDHPGPSVENFHSSARSGSGSNVLLDTDAGVVYSKEKLQIRSPENDQHEDSEKLCAGYLRDSASQLYLEIIDDEVPEAVCRHPQVLASVEDPKLEGEIVDSPDSHDNVGEETFSKTSPQKLNQSEVASREAEDIPVQKIEKLNLSPTTYWGDVECKSGDINDSRNSPDGNKEFDSPHIDQPDQERTSHSSVSPGTIGEISGSPETSLCAIQVPHDQRIPSSHGLQDAILSKLPHDQECFQAERFDPSEDLPSLDHSLHAGMENCTSSDGLVRRSQHGEGSPAKHVHTPQINHQGVKRSRSQSPVRQRNSSSRYKRDPRISSETRFPYSRGWRNRSSETTACFHQSPGSPHRSVNPEGHKQLSYYSTSRNNKNYLARSDRGREVTSKDHLPVTSWQNSATQRESRRRFKDSSSSKHVPGSPSNASSQHSRKVERSDSPSPVSRRNLKRERDKSRPRSPHTRDYCRMRYSPRHKSPSRSYSSHHRSLKVRYLSPASYRRTGIGKPGTCLFVAGFGFSTTERELERKFSRFGHVRDVRIIRDKRSGISRGYGFLSLERDEEADAAIRALHKTDWNGRVVLVEKSIK